MKRVYLMGTAVVFSTFAWGQESFNKDEATVVFNLGVAQGQLIEAQKRFQELQAQAEPVLKKLRGEPEQKPEQK